MSTVQYPLHVNPEEVRILHQFYGRHTCRNYAFNERIEAGYVQLLSKGSLAGLPVTPQDIEMTIRYLHRRVNDEAFRRRYGQRHAGCLKLTADNFFNVDKFREDLAEAQAIMGRWKQSKAAKPAPAPEPIRDSGPPVAPDPGVMAELAARKLRRQAKP